METSGKIINILNYFSSILQRLFQMCIVHQRSVFLTLCFMFETIVKFRANVKTIPVHVCFKMFCYLNPKFFLRLNLSTWKKYSP
jgi:hypothetical protein